MNYFPTWTIGPRPGGTAPHLGSATGGDAPIRHSSWCMAYSRLMAGLVTGNGFLALLGPAGTGKTWLLQAVMAALQEQGRPVELVRWGEFAAEALPGTVLLIDEAARMDGAKLAQLASVRNAGIVVAGLPDFAARLEPLPCCPDIVPLPPLPPGDVASFAEEWLALQGVPARVLTEQAVERLHGHSGGVPRLAVQFLRAALAMGGTAGAARIGADEMDEVAAFRLGGLDAEAAIPLEGDSPARAVDPAPAASAGSAAAIAPVEASVLEAPARPRLGRRRTGVAVAFAAAACLLAAALTIRHDGGRSDPAPAMALTQALPAGSGAVPDRDAGPADNAIEPPTKPPDVAGSTLTKVPMGTVPDPSRPAPDPRRPRLATSSAPRDDAVVDGRAGQEGGAPGLLLLAHAGDTMPSLYARVYRGVQPPPYADVVAANRLPIKPGAILVFPAPLAGWMPR